MATATTEKAVKEARETGNPETAPIHFSEKELKEAKAFWANTKKKGKTDRKGWALLGKVCADFKAYQLSLTGKPVSTQEFSKWRESHFPGIRNELVSYAQRLSENFKAINDWATQHCPDLSTPKHLVGKYDAWNRNKGNLAIVKNRTTGKESAQSIDTKGAADGSLVTHQTLEAVQADIAGKLFSRIDSDTNALYDAIRNKRDGLSAQQRALLKNRFTAILKLIE